MDIERLDINAVCLGILCNFTPVCGEDRAEEAAGLVRTLQSENEKLRAELEQVKRDFDGLCEYIDSEGFLRKQFCENGNPDLEPCICPSLQEHPGYIDSDDCEVCDHFCNSWRGPEGEHCANYYH